jgi:pimeloyl-ACP methyl ester carboxylesterase
MIPTRAAVPTATVAQKSTIHLEPCRRAERAALCGSLAVFEDRAAQTGRKIDLQVAVIKATSAQPAPDPIFWLPGGPGQSAIDSGGYAMQILSDANERRDVVMVDLRGTGGSNKLVCPQTIEPSLQVESLRSCLKNLNGDARAYTTAWAMDDVDDVRVALGYDQINLYGGSYGTEAAQVYLIRHGEHVRAAAMDGATLLDIPIFEKMPIASQNALDKLFARCEAEAACHSALPNLRQEFEDELARLEQKPVTMPFEDRATGQPFVLTAEKFKNVVHSGLVSTPTMVMVPRFIHLLYIEDWNGLADFLAPFMNDESSTPQWQIMNLTILCNEDWAIMRRAEIDAASAESYLTYADVRAITVPENICAAMPKPKAEALYGEVSRSNVPILFFNGGVDPQDPTENVAGYKERYPNSMELVAPGQAHGFTGIPCRGSIVAEFITKGSVEGLSTECLGEVELPSFPK